MAYWRPSPSRAAIRARSRRFSSQMWSVRFLAQTGPDPGANHRRTEPLADGHYGCLEYPRLDFTRVGHIHMPELHRTFG